jgi:hypothetical protein
VLKRERDAASAGFLFMKALPQMLVEARVREVFQRLPLLDGFSLDDDLWLCDLEVRAWPGCEWGDPVYREIGAAIAELIAEVEDEGANELLRGRSFARTLQ